jgi:hypothetical protein
VTAVAMVFLLDERDRGSDRPPSLTALAERNWFAALDQAKDRFRMQVRAFGVQLALDVQDRAHQRSSSGRGCSQAWIASSMPTTLSGGARHSY